MTTATRSGAQRQGEEGFTLLEAFVVLMIIAVLGIISAPAIMNALTHQRLSSAVNSFVSQVEFARVQAALRGRAYRIRVELSDGTNSGAIHLDEGIGSTCTLATFQTGGATEPLLGVRSVDFGTEHNEVRIDHAEPAGLLSGTGMKLCIKPDGRLLSEEGAPLPAEEDYGAGDALFRMHLYAGSGSSAAVTPLGREIVVPYNGIPRARSISQ